MTILERLAVGLGARGDGDACGVAGKSTRTDRQRACPTGGIRIQRDGAKKRAGHPNLLVTLAQLGEEVEANVRKVRGCDHLIELGTSVRDRPSLISVVNDEVSCLRHLQPTRALFVRLEGFAHRRPCRPFDNRGRPRFRVAVDERIARGIDRQTIVQLDGRARERLQELSALVEFKERRLLTVRGAHDRAPNVAVGIHNEGVD